jgi:hypothetical protein
VRRFANVRAITTQTVESEIVREDEDDIRLYPGFSSRGEAWQTKQQKREDAFHDGGWDRKTEITG